MAAKPRIRQADIAREAGVSIATVDRVLNARPGVKEHTAKRIRDAIERLGRSTGGAKGAAPSYRFDFILPANPNIFISMLEDATRETGQDMAADGVTIRCHRVEGFNPDVLAAAIRDIGATSDGLTIMALENPTVREAVNDVVDAGIPVVTIVSNLATSRKTGYVGLNNRAGGRSAGYLMGRFLPQGPGKLALFEGSLDLAYRDHQERETGFRDALREQFPHLDLLGRWQTQDDSEIAYRLTERLLGEYPDVAGIYCVGGGLRGIGGALRNLGRARDVVLIGHELTRYSRPLLIDGTVDAIIDQNPAFEVRQATKMLLGHHTGMGQLTHEMPRVEIYFRENLP